MRLIGFKKLLRCEPCMRIHAKRAMEQGATKEQIAEAMAVSMFIASGSQALWSSVHEEILQMSDTNVLVN